MPKRTIKRPVDRKAAVEAVLDNAVDTLSESIILLKQEIRDIATGKADESQHDPGSRIAFIADKVGRIADSVRKVEAARRRRDEELEMPRVIAWLRQLGAGDLARVSREIQNMSRRGGVLG